MLVKFLKFRDKEEVHDNDIDNDFLYVTEYYKSGKCFKCSEEKRF